MTITHVFPNIYVDSVLRYIPLEKDVFLVIAIFNKFPKEYLTKLSEHYESFYKKSEHGKHSGESYLISFDLNHVKHCVTYLVNQRLIKQREGVDEFYNLTSRGESFIQFVRENLYSDICEQECDNLGKKKHPVFWRLARSFIE